MAADPDINLWAIDEVHFQQYGSRCRMWIPPEIIDPVVKHHPTRKGIGYYGAVRISDGMFVFSREPNRFNAETFKEFLVQLQDVSRIPGNRIVVITDNAKYHHAKFHESWRVEHSESFVLDFLPPYSPELNPIERVWKLTRRMCLHNRYFATLEEVIRTVESQFVKWTSSNDVLRRLCAIT